MQSFAIVAFGLLAISMGADAQVGIPCHKDLLLFTPRHSLNLSEFMGTWYPHEIAGSHIGNFPEPTYRCPVRQLSHPNEDDLLSISSIDTMVNSTTRETIIESSDISVNQTRSPYSALWNAKTGEVSSDIVILFADLEFNDWTVIYQCAILEPDNYRFETVTALTRSRTITPYLRSTLKALMVGFGLRIGDHHPIDQTNCTN